jgi:DNA repair ATPase RecN
MIIANPIYDTVFKWLMENERAARFFIGTLLDQEITSVKMLPQEFAYRNKLDKLAIFRLDFMATVLTGTGAYQKILIEVQKAKQETDLMRFRGYLGEQYKKREKIEGEKIALPITTIYVLGFQLPEIDTACLKVGREYQDLINNVPITARSPFVEKLTHDSYIVQVGRITGRYQTRLDKLLSIFEQSCFVDEKEAVKHYKYNLDDVEVKAITELLHHAGTNPAKRKELDKEIEARRTLDEWFGKQYETIVEKDKQLAEKDKQLAENEKQLVEKDEKLAEKDEKLAEKDEKLAEKDEKLAEAEREIAALKAQLKSEGKM